jgi:uncharacterized membrane protein
MYLWLKCLHVLAVVCFLGNIGTGLFWHAHAARTGDRALLAHAVEGIIRSDRWLTVPGVVAIVATGVALAMQAGLPILRTRWIAGTLLLFVLSGLVFIARVAPLQRQMRDLATGATAAFDPSAYGRLARRWEAWGALALATPLAGLALMVLKPAA